MKDKYFSFKTRAKFEKYQDQLVYPRKEKKMEILKVDDKVKLHTASGHFDNGICTVTKIRNYATKGQRIYLTSEYGYGFMMWLKNMNYEKVS